MLTISSESKTSDQSSFFTANTKGALLAFLCTAIWSANFIVGRIVIDAVSPVTLAFVRWFIALAFLLPFTIRGVIKERRHFITHWRYYLAVAVAGVTVLNTCVYIAAHTVPALNLSLIATFVASFCSDIITDCLWGSHH